MPNLIKNRQLVTDDWQTLAADAVAPGLTFPAGKIIVPLAVWLERRDELLARGKVGVALAADAEPAQLANDVAALPLVTVDFPKFADGRGYSIARLLRERYGYTGELRAVGDVGRDQLFYLSRVGFDAFLIPDGRDAQAAIASFDDFPEAYQTGTDRPVPLFRRRAA